MWESWKPTLRLGADELHVIVWPIARSGDDRGIADDAWESLAPMLDSAERARAARFVFARHRLGYAQAHATMRHVLSCYLGTRAVSVAYGADPLGKPRLANPGAALQFNLSHTDGVCALAVAVEAAVGIDVERVRAIGAEVAESHFSGVELRQLRGLRGAAWREGFFRCWTGKEAVLKGEGLGLRTPLDSFDVSLGARAGVLGWRPEAGFRREWRLEWFEPEAGVVGTVACSAGRRAVFLRMAGAAEV